MRAEMKCNEDHCFQTGLFALEQILAEGDFIRVQITIVGGNDLEMTRVYSFSSLDESWKIQPDFQNPRRDPIAGLITYGNQTQAIVVAGGFKETTSEIFSLASLKWQSGPNLPNDLHLCPVVQYQNTFLAIGGKISSNATYINKILKYDVDSDSWMTIQQQLGMEKALSTAFLVPDSYC